jgi:hypothetical protein
VQLLEVGEVMRLVGRKGGVRVIVGRLGDEGGKGIGMMRSMRRG